MSSVFILRVLTCKEIWSSLPLVNYICILFEGLYIGIVGI
jgi:hypothetical protein